MKFSAHIAFMFKEIPFQDRYFAVKELGFKGVESSFPDFSENELQDIVGAKEKSGLEQILLNIYNGDKIKDSTNDGLGCAATPGEEKEFAERLNRTIDLAKLLKCSRIHLMSGTVKDNISREEQLRCYTQNMMAAAEQLSKHNMVGLIEPINKYSVPNYFMNNYEEALQVIQNVNRPQLRLLLDVFHCQQIRGNLSRAIDDYFDVIGHIQVAQVPHRGEPDTSGELNYRYIFSHLECLGYDQWIGCEYNPTRGSNTASWVQNYGYYL